MHNFKTTLNVILLSISIGFLSNIANATVYNTVTGQLIKKEPVYTSVQQRQPQQVCSTVDVPVYGTVQNGNSGATGGDVLAGAIIGGILGKAITGQDNGAGFGALVGAMTSAEKKKGGTNQQIVGYTKENRCSTQYVTVQKKVANQYKLVYLVNGSEVSIVVNSAVARNSFIGQHKQFRIHYQLLN